MRQTICDMTSSNVLRRLVQCEHRLFTILFMVWAERVEQGRVGIHTQRVKTAWLCLGLGIKIPQ